MATLLMIKIYVGQVNRLKEDALQLITSNTLYNICQLKNNLHTTIILIPSASDDALVRWTRSEG